MLNIIPVNTKFLNFKENPYTIFYEFRTDEAKILRRALRLE